MSRHRNMLNIIADDDYYDYDDDYYDDYDDYDDYGGQSYSQPKPKAQPKTQQVQIKTKQSNNKQAKKGQAQQANKQKATPAVATASKITKPPPGWDKPAGSTAPVSAANAGISKPPAGWGKPSPPAGATTTIPAKASAASDSQAKPQSPAPAAPAAPVARKIPEILQQKHAVKTQNGHVENQISMVVIGHVDAGKSTMMGQMLYQVGQVTKREATKVSNSGTSSDSNSKGKKSDGGDNIQWAWLLDEDEGERNRGVTMQIATKTISTPNHPHIIILDAPGHAEFVPTMITGAANADAGLLVVDASADSAFEAAFTRGGQTKEHIMLARGLGVSQLVVCVNKLDVRDWSKEVYEDIQNRLIPFLTTHATFLKKRIKFVPTSGLTGVNVKDKKNIPPALSKWYKGPTVFEAIDSFQQVKQTSLDQPFRIILSDVYGEGRGVRVRGRIVQGFIKVGEKVVVLPIGDDATVHSIDHLHPHDDLERSKYAAIGETVDLNLMGIDLMRVTTGSVLSRTAIPERPAIATKCRAKLAIMDDLAMPIIRGAQVLFHIHSLDIPATLTQLISTTKRSNNVTRNKPRAITAASSAVVQITLSNPICMEAYNSCRALGRFVLRRSGDTLAVGIIEEVLG